MDSEELEEMEIAGTRDTMAFVFTTPPNPGEDEKAISCPPMTEDQARKTLDELLPHVDKSHLKWLGYRKQWWNDCVYIELSEAVTAEMLAGAPNPGVTEVYVPTGSMNKYLSWKITVVFNQAGQLVAAGVRQEYLSSAKQILEDWETAGFPVYWKANKDRR